MEAKNVQALLELVQTNRKELFTLKMNMLTGQVKNVSQFKKLRRDIARALTEVRTQQLAENRAVK